MDKFDFIRLKDKEQWGVLMRPDDPLAKKETISAKDLENAPLILPRRINVQNELVNWFGNSFQESQALFTSNLNTNSALLVQNGLAYSLVIEGSIPFWDKEKITFRPLSPQLTSTSVLTWKKQQPFSPAATKFIQHMRCFLGMIPACFSVLLSVKNGIYCYIVMENQLKMSYRVWQIVLIKLL